MGLPEGFVVDGVECGVAAIAADAGAEFAVDATPEYHRCWFRFHFDGESFFAEMSLIDNLDIGDHVGGLAGGANHCDIVSLGGAACFHSRRHGRYCTVFMASWTVATGVMAPERKSRWAPARRPTVHLLLMRAETSPLNAQRCSG